jgi:hypothetical protein
MAKDENKKTRVMDLSLDLAEKLGMVGNRIMDNSETTDEEKLNSALPVLKGMTDALKATQKLEDSSGMFFLDDDESVEVPDLNSEPIKKIKKQSKKNDMKEASL